MLRRNLGETRQAILDAGVELLEANGFALEGVNISLIDACRQAGLTTAGSGYKIWATQREFQTELVHHLLDAGNAAMVRAEGMIEAVGVAGDNPDLATLIRIVATENASTTIGSPAHVRSVALWLAALGDDELQEGFAQSLRTQFDGLVELYRGLLTTFDREMVPPFTVEMLMLAVASEVAGLAFQSPHLPHIQVERIMRPTGPDGKPEPWNLLGCVIEAVIEAFTRPRSPTTDVNSPVDRPAN